MLVEDPSERVSPFARAHYQYRPVVIALFPYITEKEVQAGPDHREQEQVNDKEHYYKRPAYVLELENEKGRHENEAAREDCFQYRRERLQKVLNPYRLVAAVMQKEKEPDRSDQVEKEKVRGKRLELDIADLGAQNISRVKR